MEVTHQNPSIQEQVKFYRDALKQIKSERPETPITDENHNTLNRIWSPSFRKPKKACRYFEEVNTKTFHYTGDELFPNRTFQSLSLFGGLAYQVKRETVASLGGRLLEIGSQTFVNHQGHSTSIPMALIETSRPKNKKLDGEQVILMNNGEEYSASEIERALVTTLSRSNAISIETPTHSKRRNQQHNILLTIPGEISWDGAPHEIKISFSLKLPKSEGNGFESLLLRLFKLNNGRPAQHYQNEAAAMIRLEELIFANPKSILVKIDGNSIEPDSLFGKKLILLLSQTAGGFFEKSYFQNRDGLFQISNNGTSPLNHRSQTTQETKLDNIATNPALAQTHLIQNRRTLSSGDIVNELTQIQWRDSNNKTLMAVDFNTGDGNGLRDLNYFSRIPQTGKFKISIQGEEGFSFGQVLVSPTKEVETNVYYTSITLTPAFPTDMKHKTIILHVIQNDAGTYTETEIQPNTLVHPPEFKL